MPDLILASASPRRQDLLEEAGIHFRVEHPDIDEWDSLTHPELSPHEIALANARRKAEVVHLRNKDSVILAADTVVYCAGRLLGKPADTKEAEEMLLWLSGRTHEVLTAVAWCNPAVHVIREQVARTWVTFRPLEKKVIEAYMAKVHVLDKAGAYAMQEHGCDLIERLEGSKTNVIGLPMEIVEPWWREWHRGGA